MRHLQRPDGRIAYELHNPETTAPLIVCIPGMGDVRATYRHLAPALSAAGYRVAVMDLRGHGDSDISFTDYSTVATAHDAVTLIEELGGGPALVVGNSLGGTAAAWAAAVRPDLVGGLVLIAAFLRGEGMSGVQEASMRAMLLRPWGPSFVSRYLAGLFKGGKAADHADHLAAIRAHLAPPERYRAIRRLVENAFHPVPARLDEVVAPALVVMGELDSDWPDPAEEAAWMAERLGARRLMLAESGHYPQAQQAEAVAEAVLDFARTDDGAPGMPPPRA
ncbi:alpha/beta fold hydrolase [Streptomonospora litoralis]|uniref:Tropinesterase n=1 Tax=Streptomonospora litoralis TaxID=2498135 RepID=A0A4P6Q852_9ACTN|nr:alpha/beta fold hydrolase [Streptomonospora litoralis]QBI55067.1 Tropinesterase [Streptomonospora litoralis]